MILTCVLFVSILNRAIFLNCVILGLLISNCGQKGQRVYFFINICSVYRFLLRKWDFLLDWIAVHFLIMVIHNVCQYSNQVNWSYIVLLFQFSDTNCFPFWILTILGCCRAWTESEVRIATLEFDRDRKSMGVIVNSKLGKKSLLVKVLLFSYLNTSAHLEYIGSRYIWWSVLPFLSFLPHKY